MTSDTVSTIAPAPAEPVLRTLAPALRQLERSLRGWLDGAHRYPLSTLNHAILEGLTGDLRRQADALDVDRPVLVIMLMGGTGVGKSTLLNALAGGSIAQASFTRPTTRDPVVYYHDAIRTERLDRSLQHCRLVPHDRPALEQKVLVDTPDLDSNDLANRDKLLQILPVADVVLYVGSQEKYHDLLGWELFLQQRRRRAFAFVLNKWDRCLHGATTGVRPDEDLLHDLEAEGFQHPLLFRTCAQTWVDRAAGKGVAEPPEGEQFGELVHWLEMGLSRLEIEAIKARGVSQLLQQLRHALAAASPPDLADVAARTRAAWERPLTEEATAAAGILLDTLDPYQREVEHHFALEGQRRFRGMMAGYLHLITRLKYIGSTLREHIPLATRTKGDKAPATASDLATFTRACSDVAANRHLDARGKALANRLLLEADQQGFPIDLLTEPVESVARIDWRYRYAQTLSDVLQEVEQKWSRPKGIRRWAQTGLVLLADWVPLVVLVATCALLLWRIIVEGVEFRLQDLLLPAATVLITLVILHVLIALLLPLRWAAIRSEFQRRLEARLKTELASTYAPVPEDVAAQLAEERQRVEALQKEAADVAAWLEQREQAVSVAGLYGNEQGTGMADGKWISDLPATAPLATAARRVLAVRLNAVRHYLPFALHAADADVEHVHQLRVSTRRAGAALDLFGLCLPEKTYRAGRKQLRRLRRAAGAARDWDVFLAGLTPEGSRPPETARAGLDFLIGYASAQRQLAQGQLRAEGTDPVAALDHLVAETVAALRQPSDEFTSATLGDLARPRLLALLRELDVAAAGDLHDYAHLHQVRIIGKRLRYAMEIFAECFAPPFRDTLYPAIEAMQDILGRANDSHVAVQRLTGLRTSVRATRPGDWKRYRAGVERLLHFHQHRLPRERHQFVRWWRRWQTSGAEELLAELLGTDQAAAR